MNELNPLQLSQSVVASASSKEAEVSTNGKELPVSKPAPRSEEVTQVTADDKVEEAVAKLNDFVQSTLWDLEFATDGESGRMIVTVKNQDTGEVIRQIPEEVVLRLARNLNAEEPLRLFSAQA